MRTAIYIRVSTDEQANEGFSIASQKERLTAYVHSQEWDIYDFYVDDGYSAKDTKRPALQRMLKDAENNKIDVVLVHKLDRFTRNVRDLYSLLDDFEKCKVGFRSAQEQFDTTTPLGRAMMGMLGIFAQWERETIAERVYWGQEQMVNEGKRPGAIAPIGYDLVDGELIVNPIEAKFVRELFTLYINNNGIPTIAKILHERNITMNVGTIHYILMNPIYSGKIRWNYRKNGIRTNNETIVDADHEAIISEEEFALVQSLLKKRGQSKRAATSDFPFTGIIKCSRCGNSFAGCSRLRKKKSGTVKERFYRCSGKINYGSCDMPHIAEWKIEEEFLRVLEIDKKQLSKMVNIPKPPKEKSALDEMKRELDQIAKRRKRWQVAFANGLIELDELRQHIEPDKKKESELRESINNLPEIKAPSYTKEEFISQLLQLRKIWPEIDDSMAKKMFIEDLFESITIHTDAEPFKHNFKIEIVEWTIK